METYTVIKRGKSIKNCIDIPLEYLDKELEISIRPIFKGGGDLRKKIEQLLEKNINIKPFQSIADPTLWQKEQRSDW